jgi:Nuclease-related domain
MESKHRILIGSPLHGEEAAFLHTLTADLDCDALILANFVVGNRQIDFVVIVARFAALIELKNYRRPVFGAMNGEWHVHDAAGNVVPDVRFNPYQQTLQEAYALSDAMRAYQRRNASVPAAAKSAYYRFFQSFVCIYPAIHTDSKVTKGDYRVRIRSYRDVLNAICTDCTEPGWSLEDWAAFAERALKLHPVTLQAAIDPGALTAQAELAGYRHRLQNTLSVGLAPLLRDAGGAPYGVSLIQAMRGTQNVLLHGPSGSAKTFHLHHLALAMAASETEVPFLIDAKRYRGGEFCDLLRQSTAPHFAGDLKSLMRAFADTGIRPVLMIDALNECPESAQSDLLSGALAFALKYNARTIITAQSAAIPLGGFHADRIPLALPTSLQKRKIYAYHAGIAPSPDIDALCGSFDNAYDLVLAGRCHSDGAPPQSRAELYDRYLARSLPTQSPYLAAALLRYVAGYMHNTISIALSRNRFEEIAERFLSENSISVSILDPLLQSRVVDLTADSFSFEHELLLTYLAAEQLRRSAAHCDALVVELRKPRNASLFEFILPRLDETEAGNIMQAARDKDVMRAILRGECGTSAQAAIRRLLKSFIAEAIDDLNNVSAEIKLFTDDDGKRRIVDVLVRQGRTWSEQEKLLASILVDALYDASLRSVALSLLDASEAALRKAVERAATAESVGFRSAWAETLRLHGGVVSHRAMLPCSVMLYDLHQRLMRFDGREDRGDVREALLIRAQAQPCSDFALLALLEDHDLLASPTRVSDNIALIQIAWESGIGPHCLSALQALPNMRGAVDECDPEEKSRVLDFVQGLSSQNPLLNSLIFETQALFEVMEPPVSLQDAIAEMRTAAMAEPADHADFAVIAALHNVSVGEMLAANAYGLLANIFEDVFQGVYYKAYRTLRDDERLRLLTLAAQREERGFHTAWILRELLQYGEAAPLSTFEHYLRAVDFNGNFLQDELAAAVVAIEAWAKCSSSPPPLGSATPEFDQAFQTIGAALYWAYRGDAAPEQRASMKRKWNHLSNDDRLASGVVLHELRSASWLATPTDREVVPDLRSLWDSEVEAIAIHCVKNRDTLMARFGRHAYDNRLVKDMIETLGAIGSARALSVLREAADDSLYSSEAISAVQSIQRRGVRIV